MIQINPREVAAETLMDIMGEKTYNNLALKRQLKQNGAMPPKDKAFVTEIVNGVLRNRYYLDYIIDNVSTIKTAKMKPWVAAVLRMGVYQMYFMNVPDSAACNESVRLIKEKGLGKLSGFANGVLRGVIRNRETLQLPDEKKQPLEYLAVRYSHPLWLLKMWNHYYGYEFVKALCEKNNEPSDVTICVNTLKQSVGQLKARLQDEGVLVKDGHLLKEALHISKTSDIGRLQSFREGLFHVQDESSMLAAAALDPQPGDRVLDVCAAPGGKSFFIGGRMQNDGVVVARDLHEHKLELIAEGARRLGMSIIKTENKDACIPDGNSIGVFDRVLVDAPCSGLGLIRKKPDIRLHKQGDDIDQLTRLQHDILKQAACYVRPGGVLVYSTCTLCRKENERNVEIFLSENGEFALESLIPYIPETLAQEETAAKGYLTLFPHVHGTDGFFIARLKRKEQ